MYVITGRPEAAHTIGLSHNRAGGPSRASLDTPLSCNEIYSEKGKDSEREDWVSWPRGERLSSNYVLTPAEQATEVVTRQRHCLWPPHS